MSLKCYISPEVKDSDKEDSGSILVGVQIAQSEWLLPIYEAYYSTNSAISSITLNELDIYGNFVSSTTLATNLIAYDVASSQYLVDKTKDVALNNGLFEIVFVNADSKTITTEPFVINEDATTPWILEDGIWNDNGIWNDSKLWID